MTSHGTGHMTLDRLDFTDLLLILDTEIADLLFELTHATHELRVSISAGI